MTTPHVPPHYSDMLPLYVAGHVSPEERAAIDWHLAECVVCRRECDLWRTLPDAFASLDAAPSSDLATDETWSALAPRLDDNARQNGRTIFMSFTSDSPPQPPAQAQATRTMRPNIWITAAVILAIIIPLLGGFAIFKGHGTSQPLLVGGKPAATATATAATATATLVPSELVTEGDAQALFGGFLPACEDVATYALAGQGVPCAKLDRGRIYEVGGHYCADDWHLVSSQLVDSKANLEKYKPQQTIDGVTLQTTRTAIKPVDPAYSQQHYGGQYYYIQIGVVLSPQQISAGKHSLRQFAPAIGFDRTIPFTIDASGTGVCKKH
jgi:hypothetical protein